MSDLGGVLQRHVRSVAAVGILVVLLVAWWFAWMQPESHKIAAAQAQLQAVQSSELQVEAQLATLRADKRAVELAIPFFKTFSRSIPSEPDDAQLITQVYYLSQRTNVTLNSITPANGLSGTPTLGYSEVSVNISVQGTLGDIERFVAGLTGQGRTPLPRLMTIQSLSLSGNAQGNVLTAQAQPYSATISAMAYTTALPATAGA